MNDSIALHVKNVACKISQQFLTNFSFTLNRGEIWGILGQNGCGKTTLLQSLAGFNRDYSGEILLQNKNIHDYSIKELARLRAFLWQEDHYFFPQTVWDFCRLARFPYLSFLKIESAYDYGIVAESLRVMELDAKLQQNVQTLSGGEKRRLMIASVLAQQPDLYFLDEPTNHLDLRHQWLTLTHFHDLAKNQGAAVLMSLHDLHYAQQFCDGLILLFNDGTYLKGPTAEIATQENFSRLYNVLFSDKVAAWTVRETSL